MKKLLIYSVILVALIFTASLSHASMVTYTYDPTDLLLDKPGSHSFTFDNIGSDFLSLDSASLKVYLYDDDGDDGNSNASKEQAIIYANGNWIFSTPFLDMSDLSTNFYGPFDVYEYITNMTLELTTTVTADNKDFYYNKLELTGTGTPVPIPPSAMLFGGALIALGGFRLYIKSKRPYRARM